MHLRGSWSPGAEDRSGPTWTPTLSNWLRCVLDEGHYKLLGREAVHIIEVQVEDGLELVNGRHQVLYFLFQGTFRGLLWPAVNTWFRIDSCSPGEGAEFGELENT
jgi:hypothetical protein